MNCHLLVFVSVLFGTSLLANAVPVHYALDIRAVANMELADQKAKDGKGGWTDQGEWQDGRHFAPFLVKRLYEGVPLEPSCEGKCVLTMKSGFVFPSGPEQVVCPVKPPFSARSLFLLHTVAWPVADVGRIVLTDTQGNTHTAEVQNNRDVSDWYFGSTQLTNAYPAITAKNESGNDTALFLSKFPLPSRLGPIVSVTFQSRNRAAWIILAASLTQDDLPFPELQPLIIQEGGEWRKAPLAYPVRIQAGSALDLTNYRRRESVDELGRIVLRNGHFQYGNHPKTRAKFHVNVFDPVPLKDYTHAQCEQFADAMVLHGYNMIRLHFLDAALMVQAKEPLDFNEKVWDNLEYLLSLCKQRGIYVMFDAMTSWLGYNPGHIWAQGNRDGRISYKWRIALEPEARENWAKGVRKILLHKNPYTGTRLVDDPILAMVIAFNEEEFGFLKNFNPDIVGPHWRAFLKKRYGSVDALQKAWGSSEKFVSFEDVPLWSPGNFSGVQGNDAALFTYSLESDLMKWYAAELRRMGYPGPMTGFNMGKSADFAFKRLSGDFVAMNAYHTHPNGSRMSQVASSGNALAYCREFGSTRAVGKPYVVSEHGAVFWNRFRYEQAFGIGAYAALQDFDAVTVHSAGVSLGSNPVIMPFAIAPDPVHRVSEFLTHFLFIRGDVRPARPRVRIRVNQEEVYRPNGPKAGMPKEQSLISLLTGFSLECVPTGAQPLPLRKGELAFQFGTPAKLVVGNGFMTTEDNPAASAMDIVKDFKRRGFLSENNRSNGQSIFEAETGELYLDTRRQYIEVNTPCLQGICAKAGSTAKLPEIHIERMTCDGILALVSIDGRKPLRKANRMVLCYATNALNTGMRFASKDMTVREDYGKPPALVQCGQFQVSIRHAHPKDLRLHPLDFSGNRLKTIAPAKISDGHAVFTVDMLRDGHAFFYELTLD
ncbi:MAG: beta-galactosidase [Victivallales bacterium]|nr:beta-galactosidase [Victivallales bacterium]